MIQKNTIIPFSVELSKKIQNHDLPGRIITASGNIARIIDYTYKATEMLVMVMDKEGIERDRVYLISGEPVYGNDNLLIQVPEWATYKNGDVVCCEWRTATDSSQWLAILDGEVEYLSTGQPMFWHYADVVIHSTCEPTRLYVQRRASSSQMTVNRADDSERRLMAEYLIKEGSADAMTLLHRFLPEYVRLLPDNKGKCHE